MSTIVRLVGIALCFHNALATSQCKSTPLEQSWPSTADWKALNSSIDGTLLSTVPVASSCWAGNPFNSTVSCNYTDSQWTSSLFHASLPESIDAPLFANDSCVPPADSGYVLSRGCHLGGLPSYIVNATTEAQIATAMKWAADRNIRIVIKGSGHDLNGRSSGAYALSIWTRHFRTLEHNPQWRLTKTSAPQDVITIGSGWGWGDILNYALSLNRVVTTGQSGSVGPGGYIQGGGHGPLASTYGLGAQQVLQARVITTTGQILTASNVQNQDIFWAIRGGGGGQYGVVTEYVILAHPAPASVVFGSLSVAPLSEAGNNASWDAAAVLFKNLPDLMDAGIAGAVSVASGLTAQTFNPTVKGYTAGVAFTQALWAFNTTPAAIEALFDPVLKQMRAYGSNNTLSISYSASNAGNYSNFYAGISGTNVAGGGGVSSSRLLGRDELCDVPHAQLRSYIQRTLAAQNATQGNYVTVGLSGGPGVHNAPEERWGALNPSWRKAYLHLLVGGQDVGMNATTTPKTVLAESAKWLQDNKESLWNEWAPNMGAYMNEGNPYNQDFKKVFYGSSYPGLEAVKAKYDPTQSLYVLSGVGSDRWDYDLDSGELCKC